MPQTQTADLDTAEEPVEPAETPEESAEEPKRRGRPPREPDITRMGVFQAMKHVDWESNRWMAYIYRVEPWPGKREKPNYLCVVNEPIDQEWLASNYGSGKYNIKLNRAKARGGDEGVLSESVTIRDPKRPPKMDNDTWMDLAVNSSWVPKKDEPKPIEQQAARAGLSVDDLDRLIGVAERLRPHVPQSVADKGPEAIVSMVIDQMSKAGEAQRQMMMQQMANDSPSKTIELVTMIVGMLKPQQQQESPLLAALAPVLPNLMERLFAPPPAPPDPIEQLTKLLEVQSKLRGESGDGERSGGSSNKWGFYSEIVQAVPEALREVNTLFGNIRGMRETQPARPRPAQPAGQDRQPQQIAQDENAQMFHNFIAAIAQPLLQYLAADGVTGQDFAAWLIDGYGEATWQQLKALGAAQIKPHLLEHPALKEPLSKLPAGVLDQFLGEFMLGAPADDEPEDESEE